VLCQQTQDLVTARDWLDTLTAGGIEGVVIKDPTGTYPPLMGRPWWKHKAKTTLDMLAIGFTGTSGTSDAAGLAGPRLSGRGR
jgi:ATP-dependent DNA ligase